MIIIGIAGISRSGKSTLRRSLIEKLKINEESVFKIDSYLISKPELTLDKDNNKMIENWELPESYNLEKLYEDLVNRINQVKEANKNEIILVEGFLLFTIKKIVDLLDLTFYIKVDKVIALERRRLTKCDDDLDYYFENYIWKYFFINK